MTCPQCGNLREECADPTRLWYPQRHICYASRVQSMADRKYDEKHKAAPFHSGRESSWAKEYSKDAPVHFRDGVRVYVAPLDVEPDDKFI